MSKEKIYKFNTKRLQLLIKNKKHLINGDMSGNDAQLILTYCEILKEKIDKAIEYIEKEKTRLAKDVSNIYTDTLDRTKLVNEDIYNELDKVLDILKGSDSNE